MARRQFSILDDDEPWCVWATPTGAKPWRGMPSVAKYGDVRDVPDGRKLPGEWRPSVCGTSDGSTPGPPVAALARPTKWFRMLFGRPDIGPFWVSTLVERTRSDGRKATALVRGLSETGLTRPSPDPAVAGSWELDDGSGASRTLRLSADGTVEGRAEAIWGMRDGALVVDPGPRGEAKLRMVEVYVLSEDRRAFDGNAMVVNAKRPPVHGTKVE
jgi:hypothetical protein